VKLVSRTKTNPAAAIFARRLLSLDFQAEESPQAAHSCDEIITESKPAVKMNTTFSTIDSQQV
jgi:hypothetical protein